MTYDVTNEKAVRLGKIDFAVNLRYLKIILLNSFLKKSVCESVSVKSKLFLQLVRFLFGL